MVNPGCRIYGDFTRPPKELVQSFRNIPVANIDDNMGRTAAIHYSIRHINAGKGTLVGTAFTVKVPEGDNLMFHKAMDMAQPGDVIMIDAGGGSERAILGALMANYCKVKKIAGIVVDGSIRDTEEIAALDDFHVFAKGITPNGPYKNGPGEIGGVISVGGRVVHPGDIIVGDDDGVVVIRPDDALEVLEKSKAVLAKEDSIMKGILKGEYVRPWVEEKLKEIGCVYL
ncbi:RraA family protein [Oscillospiraceae bacterium LTW-04]|nr:RraA family protein [Oscillospiraceae bacterium MB24-C1]